MPRDPRIGHQRMKDRRRVGETCCLDHNAIEPYLTLTSEASRRLTQGLRQIASDRTAETTTRHFNDNIIFGMRHEIVIQSDFPELIDQHECLAKLRLLD